MSWLAPRTWVVGETVTALMMNQQIRDNWLASQPVGKWEYFSQQATAVETLINGGWLEANGVAVSRTTYAALWALFGTTLARTYTQTVTLNGALTAVATTVVINAWPTGFPTQGWPIDRPFAIQVDSEVMLVTAGFGTTSLTVVRGVEGSTAATHLTAASVTTPSQNPYGSGDGSTTFTLPDVSGRGLVATAAGGHADVVIGSTDQTAKASRRPRHRHTVTNIDGRTSGASYNQSGDTGTPNSISATPFVGPSGDPITDGAPYAIAGVWACKT